MVGWIKYILTTEQKKADFKPESEEGPMQMYSKVGVATWEVTVWALCLTGPHISQAQFRGENIPPVLIV